MNRPALGFHTAAVGRMIALGPTGSIGRRLLGGLFFEGQGRIREVEDREIEVASARTSPSRRFWSGRRVAGLEIIDRNGRMLVRVRSSPANVWTAASEVGEVADWIEDSGSHLVEVVPVPNAASLVDRFLVRGIELQAVLRGKTVKVH